MKKCSKCTEYKDRFYKDAKTKDGLGYWCKDCCNQAHYSWAQRNPHRMKKWRDKYNNGARKELIKKYEQGWRELLKERFGVIECMACGYDKHFSCLDFHHTDPSMKDKQASLFSTKPTREKLSRFDGTMLLCANCHRLVHFGG